jgi:hypothetical protein
MPIQTKKGLTICAKWDTSQNQGGAIHAADRRKLGRESGSVKSPFHYETACFDWLEIGGEGSEQVGKPGPHSCQEERDVSFRESKDFKSCQEALGKG